MVQAMLGARRLIAILSALAVGAWGLHAYPVQTDNVFLALIALKKPVVFHVLTNGYATLWFTTAFLAASLVTSAFAIVAYRSPQTAPLRPLPPSRTGVAADTDARARSGILRGRWAPPQTRLTIPQRGLYTA